MKQKISEHPFGFSVLTVFIAALFGLNSFAQDTLTGFDKKFFVSLANDARNTVTTPLGWKKPELTTAGILIATTTVSFLADDEIYSLLRRNQKDEADLYMSKLFNPAGNLYGYLLVGGWYLKGMMEKDNRAKSVSLNAVKAVAINAVLTQTVKWSVKRNRPRQTTGPDADDSFNPFEDERTNDSFYSGHTSTAFAIAAVFANGYKEKKWVACLGYGLAGGAGIARLYLQKHWVSDVVTGAVMGYYIGTVVSRGAEKRLSLSFTPRQAGMVFRF